MRESDDRRNQRAGPQKRAHRWTRGQPANDLRYTRRARHDLGAVKGIAVRLDAPYLRPVFAGQLVDLEDHSKEANRLFHLEHGFGAPFPRSGASLRIVPVGD